MKKSTKRQRQAELFMLFMSLLVLSVVYVVLISKDYSTYLADQDAHKLTYEGLSSIPSVAVSQDAATPDSSSDAEAAATIDSAADSLSDGEASSVQALRLPASNAILLGDADMLSVYSYDTADATVCAISGVSAANILSATFIVPAVSTKERTAEQILNLGGYDACYLFLGVHEAEWYYADSFIEYYETLIQSIQELSPDTAIYMHAIPSVAELAKAGVTTSATDEHIDELNEKLEALAKASEGTVYFVK